MRRTRSLSAALFLAWCTTGIATWAQTAAPSAAENTQGQKTPEKPASVFGLVTNSVTGEPLAHAHVRLNNFQNGTLHYGAMTTVDGRFSIKGIVPGQYFLSAERRGYSTPVLYAFNAKPLELKPGEENSDLVARLVPDAVISGRVVDAQGVPAEGVYVEVIGGSKHSAHSDDRGEFRIGGLLQGWYLVKVVSLDQMPAEIRTDGTTPVTYGRTYYPSVRLATSATPVSTRAGLETGGIEIKLVPSPLLHLSGTLSNVPPGTRNIKVTLAGDDGDRPPDVPADQTFTVWNLPAGHYQLFATCYDDHSQEQLFTAPAEITLTNASVEGLNLTFQKLFELTGHVDVEGSNSDAKSSSITLQRLGSVGVALHTPIGSDGRFKIARVRPGRYHVMLDLDKGYYLKTVGLGMTDSDDGVVDLRGGSPQNDLTLVVGRGGAEVSGVVRDAKGPAAMVNVALFFDDEYGFDLVTGTLTAADGAYAFHGIAPGKYHILAYDPRSGAATLTSDFIALFDSVTEHLDVANGDTITQDLKLLP
ncbi:MAG TPA: carboxypeptidase-like regulatory domain-containing protein [Terriglobales bacterium]